MRNWVRFIRGRSLGGLGLRAWYTPWPRVTTTGVGEHLGLCGVEDRLEDRVPSVLPHELGRRSKPRNTQKPQCMQKFMTGKRRVRHAEGKSFSSFVKDRPKLIWSFLTCLAELNKVYCHKTKFYTELKYHCRIKSAKIVLPQRNVTPNDKKKILPARGVLIACKYEGCLFGEVPPLGWSFCERGNALGASSWERVDEDDPALPWESNDEERGRDTSSRKDTTFVLFSVNTN